VMSGENSHESVIHLLKSVSHRVNFPGGYIRFMFVVIYST
jgi:hypothetical protein